MLSFRKFTVAKKYMDKMGVGKYQDFGSKTFCLTVPKKLVGGPFRVSLISGSKKFMDKRGSIMILVKKFCLTVPKNFVGEPFSVSLIPGIKKFYA